MSNPIFNEKTIQQADVTSDLPMTISGATSKCVSYTLLLILSSTVSWTYAAQIGGLGVGAGVIIGFIAVLISAFKPSASPVLGPIYAIAQGIAIGVISSIYNAQSNGIVLQAVLLTFGTMAAMLGLYTTRIIRVTDKLRGIIFGATLGIAIAYLLDMILRAFGANVPFIHDTGALGLGISLFIVVVAAMNFLLDFDNIERGAAARLPRYYESSAAIGFLVTTVWLYLEFLRLLNRR